MGRSCGFCMWELGFELASYMTSVGEQDLSNVQLLFWDLGGANRLPTYSLLHTYEAEWSDEHE